MNIENEIYEIGLNIHQRTAGQVPGIFNKDYWHGKIMDFIMKDFSFKIDMFRFVDTLPALNSSKEISRHIEEYLIKEDRKLPHVINIALRAATSKIGAAIASKSIKKNVCDMGKRFIAGETAKEALVALRNLEKEGLLYTVDLLGEATVSEDEADAYIERYVELMESIPSGSLSPGNKGFSANVSMKITALEPNLKSIDPEGSIGRLMKRVLPIFIKAKSKNIFLNIDLEQWDMHEVTYLFFEKLLACEELREWKGFGIVVQAYLKKSKNDIDRLYDLAKKRGCPITIRLVKGAYWDYETVLASQTGQECPVFSTKEETDLNFEELARLLLDKKDVLLPAFGSHNLRSIASAIAYANSIGVPKNAYEIQMLYGMAEPERRALLEMGHSVRVYVPIGEMLPGMAYLVRRLLENTSNSGFLKLNHYSHVDIEKLMLRPEIKEVKNPNDTGEKFKNCSLVSFSVLDNRAKYEKQINDILNKAPFEVPVVVGGAEIKNKDYINRLSPNDNSIVVARIFKATTEDCERAVERSLASFPFLRDRPIVERADALLRLAEIMEKDRLHFAALQSVECAKSWRDADAEVAKAIDLCRYYAKQATLELLSKQYGCAMGEENTLIYEGRGPTAVMTHWSSPLAALCGIVVASLVSGNPVIIKPAEQAALTGYRLFLSLLAAGFTSSEVNFLPGAGREVEFFLAKEARVAQSAFTGSIDAGIEIHRLSSGFQKGQSQFKRAICELEGKNVIIVDSDADLDEAISGVVRSAFSYAGQKCSACSKVLILGDIYDLFVSRLIGAAKSLTLGSSHAPFFDICPVIDSASKNKLLSIINTPHPNAKILFKGSAPLGGNFVPVSIFETKDPSCEFAQKETLGPILTVMKAESFQEAIEVACLTEFALVGAVYSRSPKNLDEARAKFRVGNLYLNRESTTAMVNRQPFGGTGASGFGGKTGGQGYLLNFVNQRCITENTMRRGFTPDLKA